VVFSTFFLDRSSDIGRSHLLKDVNSILAVSIAFGELLSKIDWRRIGSLFLLHRLLGFVQLISPEIGIAHR
jgi:hypothetical protein